MSYPHDQYSLMCGIQLRERKGAADLMLTLCLNETIDQLAMVNILHWYGRVLSREGGDNDGL